jgi:tRNA nucleotidyltransferase (CCA-adding enzyme)
MKQTNLSHKLKELPAELCAVIADACRISRDSGYKLYLAGGAVRDMLLGKAVCDIDLTVEGDAIFLAAKLAKEKGVKAILHHRFATANLVLGDFSLDIATSRTESYERPGVLPVVAPAPLRQDLKRRDFSINAMAIGLNPDDYGQLIDYYDGQGDSSKGLVRVLYDNSFTDDATRIWRALRYEQRLGFRLENNTLKLLKRDREMLNTVSGERLRYELECILKEKEPQRALRRAGVLGVLQNLHPSLRGDDWLAERFYRAVDGFPTDKLPDVYFALLVYRLEETEVNALIDKLKPRRRTSHFLRDSVKLRLLASGFKADFSPVFIYHKLKGLETLVLKVALVAEDSTRVKKVLNLFLKELRHIKVELDGNMLKEMGIKEGKTIDNALNALLEARLLKLVTSTEDEKRFIKDYLK